MVRAGGKRVLKVKVKVKVNASVADAGDFLSSTSDGFYYSKFSSAQ